MSLRTILKSGYVRRFHANPSLAHLGDTVAHHHAMVAQIVIALHPAPSLALITAAVHHDCGELIAGDLPAPFKDAEPVIARQHAAAEDEARADMGLAWALSETDERWLRLADRLAAYVHVRQVAPHLLSGDGWPEARSVLEAMGLELGVADALSGVPSTDAPAAWQPGDKRRMGRLSRIIDEVSEATGIMDEEIRGYTRRAPVVEARQRVMYLANQAGMTTTQIGTYLNRDHSTVLHGIEREAERRRGNRGVA